MKTFCLGSLEKKSWTQPLEHVSRRFFRNRMCSSFQKICGSYCLPWRAISTSTKCDLEAFHEHRCTPRLGHSDLLLLTFHDLPTPSNFYPQEFPAPPLPLREPGSVGGVRRGRHQRGERPQKRGRLPGFDVQCSATFKCRGAGGCDARIGTHARLI